MSNISKFDKMTAEEIEMEKKEIAKIIDGNAFLSGLQKLNKTQLLILVNELTDRLDFEINLKGDYDFDERDFKDIAWDYKCLLIDILNPNFFKELNDEKSLRPLGVK